MDEKVFNYIREQIEFLKESINREIPLNMDSEFQPEAAAKIYAMQEESRQKIMQLLMKLGGGEPQQDEKQLIRQALERIAGDRAALDAAKETAIEMDDDDCKTEVIRNAVEKYETTKKEIASKLMEKLG